MWVCEVLTGQYICRTAHSWELGCCHPTLLYLLFQPTPAACGCHPHPARSPSTSVQQTEHPEPPRILLELLAVREGEDPRASLPLDSILPPPLLGASSGEGGDAGSPPRRPWKGRLSSLSAPPALWHTHSCEPTRQSPKCRGEKHGNGFSFAQQAPNPRLLYKQKFRSTFLIKSAGLRLLAVEAHDENFDLEPNASTALHCVCTALCTPCQHHLSCYQSILLLRLKMKEFSDYYFNPCFSKGKIKK